MSAEESSMQQMKPYFIVAAILLVILIAVLFWPSKQEDSVTEIPQAPISAPEQTVELAAEPEESEGITDMVDPDVFEAPKRPQEVQLSEEQVVEEFVAEEVEVDVPLDLSDGAVKSSLLNIATSKLVGQLLVNESLLQKFVINVNNLADQSLSPKDNLVKEPEGDFATYERADRTWIDNASFQRYTPYVDALESFESSELLEVYETYESSILEKYAEISKPGANFDNALIAAINELLDTPQVPVPIEVYSESVNYKFKDPRLENLSPPQKQLIRTGPENMRRIKKVLRNLKSELVSRG